jgi:hypothetical protein
MALRMIVIVSLLRACAASSMCDGMAGPQCHPQEDTTSLMQVHRPEAKRGSHKAETCTLEGNYSCDINCNTGFGQYYAHERSHEIKYVGDGFYTSVARSAVILNQSAAEGNPDFPLDCPGFEQSFMCRQSLENPGKLKCILFSRMDCDGQPVSATVDLPLKGESELLLDDTCNIQGLGRWWRPGTFLENAPAPHTCSYTCRRG